MNPIESLVQGFQDLVAGVPDLVQPVIVALAAAVPFVEGEVAAMIGVMGGINPFVAAIAAIAGNFLCVLLVVLLGARIRSAAIARRERRRQAQPSGVPAPVPVPVGTAAADAGTAGTDPATFESSSESASESASASKGEKKFRRFLVRFGVPGASLLGPLALPTQFTAALLVGSGVSKSWVLLWQGIAIVLWTTFATVSSWLALLVIYNVG